MVNKLKFKGRNDEEILVVVSDSNIEIKVTDKDYEDYVFLYPEEWDRIARFVEIARHKKNAEVHD